MSVKAHPWGDKPGKFRITIRFRWPSGEVLRDRPVIDAPSLAAARRWGEAREGELRAKGEPKPEGPKVAIPTVKDFYADFLAKHARANLHKDSGVDGQESVFRLHLIPFIGDLTLDKVSDEVVADLKSKWIAGGYIYEGQAGRMYTARSTRNPATINNRLSPLSMMLKKAHDWGKIAALPCRIRLMKRDMGREPGWYEHEVYEHIVEVAAKLDPRYLVMVLLGGDAGLRRGEIVGLDLVDVDFVRGKVAVRRHVYWKAKVRYVNTTKGNNTEWVPCTPRLLAALKAVRHLRGDRMLYTDEGEELTPGSIRVWAKAVERKAGGLPVSGKIHIYRHTFCSHLAMAGVPAMTIQRLARHKHLTTTLRYMHLSPSAKDEGIDMLAKSREAGGKPVTFHATKSG